MSRNDVTFQVEFGLYGAEWCNVMVWLSCSSVPTPAFKSGLVHETAYNFETLKSLCFSKREEIEIRLESPKCQVEAG